MKILQVIHGYPMRYNAGSEVYTQGLAQALADRGASTGLVYDCSSTCPARNWRFAVVGAGFEEVELLDTSGSGEIGVLGVLLDAVDFEGPERSFCGPVSRRIRLGWRSSRWTGQESNSAMDSGDRGGCSHNQYHVRRV